MKFIIYNIYNETILKIILVCNIIILLQSLIKYIEIKKTKV